MDNVNFLEAGRLDVQSLGQVFTPEWVVEKMLGLRRRCGRVLEPSAGDGAFMRHLDDNAVGLEVDSRHIRDERVIHRDFFAYELAQKYETIIGNPPYVRHQDILEPTRKLLDYAVFDRRTNLYLFFMWKAIDHLVPGGELILVTPRDFLKATSAKHLNARLHSEGSFTYFEELGDLPVFQGASPNCAIWRWEKGLGNRQIQDGRTFRCQDGQIWFGKQHSGRLRDHFEVRVGAVSGADHIFRNEVKDAVEMAGSKTCVTRKGTRMIYNQRHRSLNRHKEELMGRSIRKFNEDNWWQWGRKYPERSGKRIYVNVKTRNRSPFYVSHLEAFDGSLLALFPQQPDLDLRRAASVLNNIDWAEMGFVCGGRYMFTQRSLESAPVDLRS